MKRMIRTDEDTWNHARSFANLQLETKPTRYPHVQIDANAHPNVKTLVFSIHRNLFNSIRLMDFGFECTTRRRVTPPTVYELVPRTFLVSSSLFSRPRFRICPAVGAFSRPWLISAFL